MKKVIVLTILLSSLSIAPANASVKDDSKLCNQVTKITNTSIGSNQEDLLKYLSSSSTKLEMLSKKTKNKKLSSLVKNLSVSYKNVNSIPNLTDTSTAKAFVDSLASSAEKFINYCFIINNKVAN